MAGRLARPFAVFDIDGTIIRWQLYHAITDALAQKGIIDQSSFDNVRRARMNWKRRSGDNSYLDYERALITVFSSALKGLPITAHNDAAQEVFEEYKDQVYTYTRDLIRSLKEKNYLLFAISGSPEVIVEKLADYYGFDDYAASQYETEDGLYTGKVQLALGRKADLLNELIAKHHASRGGSIGVGDSEGDDAMLALVEEPIAFNPSSKLFDDACKKHWSIVVERKNVIYRLDYRSGAYRLTL